MPTHRIVSIEELSQYLHLPEKAVAKELGICLTSLKKLCRQHGITRWPYRKLKSLDKKIAKAENGTGATEDPETLKARAEDLKREKMTVAFTYGLKPTMADMDAGEKAGEASSPLSDISGTPPDMSEMLSVESMLVAEITKAVAKPKKKEPDEDKSDSILSMPASIIARSLPHVWSTYANRDSPASIPTPPNAESIDTVGEGVDADLLAEAAEDVMASNALFEDTRMSSCISWEAPTLDDSLVDPASDEIGDTPPDCNTPSSLNAAGAPPGASASKKKGAATKGGATGKAAAENTGAEKSAQAAKGKNGKASMVVASEAAPKGSAQKRKQDGAHVSEASSLASASAHRPGGADSNKRTLHLTLQDDHLTECRGERQSAPAAQKPKFDLDEEENNHSFAQDLMDSDFFSAMDQGDLRAPDAGDTDLDAAPLSRSHSIPHTLSQSLAHKTRADDEVDDSMSHSMSSATDNPFHNPPSKMDISQDSLTNEPLSLATSLCAGLANGAPDESLLGGESESWNAPQWLGGGGALTPSSREALTPSSGDVKSLRFPSPPPPSPGKDVRAKRSSTADATAASAAATTTTCTSSSSTVTATATSAKTKDQGSSSSTSKKDQAVSSTSCLASPQKEESSSSSSACSKREHAGSSASGATRNDVSRKRAREEETRQETGHATSASEPDGVGKCKTSCKTKECNKTKECKTKECKTKSEAPGKQANTQAKVTRSSAVTAAVAAAEAATEQRVTRSRRSAK